MSRPSRSAGQIRAQRTWPMVLAVAGACLAASLGLRPLIEGGAWFVGVAVAVAAVAGTGALARMAVGGRPSPTAAAAVIGAQTAALVLVITWLFVRDQAVFGLLPGRAALDSLALLLQEGATISATQAPPVDAAAGVLLMAVGGIGLIAVLVDAIAVTLGRPAVTGLALLAVYCVPVAILGGGTSWVWFVVGSVSYLIVLAVDGHERVRGWGKVLSGERSASGAVLTSATGARQAAAIAVCLAVVIPAALPSFTTGLSGYGNLGNGPGDGTRVNILNPILDIRRNLSERSDEVALVYRTSVASPGPLRVVADEVFDGVTWSPSRDEIPTSNRVQDGLSDPPGLGPDVETRGAQTSVSVGPLLNQTYLPLPYPATQIDVNGSWIYNSETLDVLGQNERTAGLDYTVTHLEVRPTAEQLRDAPAPSRDLVARSTTLPQLPDVIAATAREVAGDEGTAYDKAVRLQRWFRSAGGFTYSVEAPVGDGPNDGSLDVMSAFLSVRRGYCVHFASAMAVMARSLGIPARVGVGFLPGTSLTEGSQRQGQWEVTFRDAHAWPELYFQGVGWVRFEPTPAVQTGSPPSWTLGTSSTNDDPEASASASVSPSSSASVRPDEETSSSDSSDRTGIWSIIDAVPWRLVGLVLALAALAAAPRALGAARRAWRWRTVRTRSDRAEAAWDVLSARCADLGITWPASHTPRAVRDELVAAHELAAAARDALGRLVTELELARYAPPAAEGGRSVQDLREDVRRVVAGVAAAQPAAVRRRATWLPVTAWQGVPTLERVDDLRERIP